MTTAISIRSSRASRRNCTSTTRPPTIRDDETLYRFENAVSDRCASCGIPILPGVQRCSSCGPRDSDVVDSGKSKPDDSENTHSDEPTSGEDPETVDSESEDDDRAEDEKGSESEDEGSESVDRTGSRHCPICNESVELTDRFCPACGHDFGNRIVESGTAADSGSTEDTSAGPSQECPICGVTTRGRYCESCGSELQPNVEFVMPRLGLETNSATAVATERNLQSTPVYHSRTCYK